MNDKIKKILIPFILMIVFNLGSYYFTNSRIYTEGMSLHMGILLISGMILGPYGTVGAVAGNFLCDVFRNYNPIVCVFSAFISFGTSYLGYKLWYGSFRSESDITNIKLNSTNNVLLFLYIVLICGGLYALLHGKLIYLVFPEISAINHTIKIRFFLNYFNASFFIGIIGIWISNKRKLYHIPKVSKNKVNTRIYKITSILLILSLALALIVDQFIPINAPLAIVELIVISLLILIYLKTPVTANIITSDLKSIPEGVMNIFQMTILLIVAFGIMISYDLILLTTIETIIPLENNEVMLSMMILIDILVLIFLIPSIIVLKYIEKKVIDPILTFSKMDEFIHESEKIESEGLIDLYSNYVNEKNEIGILARSYTDLIKFNNYYIENIQEITSEKERIEAELDIATRIQASNLPTQSIENDHYIVNGYSKPAKEVGGDFFDYYEMDDDNLVIVIGDASGKGIPAAIIAMITQVMIRQIIIHNNDPSKILYLLNNQLCKNNPDLMFITLWLGIYNKTTNKLIFSNAGHEPPLLKEHDEFKRFDINPEIALGILKDYDYSSDEITLSDEIIVYTDGITDAVNNENEEYGKDKLVNFFNEFKGEGDPIQPLIGDINDFTQDQDQFDDMTLIYLKIKDNKPGF